MVVIGLDNETVFFEDPAMLGTRGTIPREEFISRWHDYAGNPPFTANSTSLSHPGIFIRGTSYPGFTYVD
jgi:predicted double-glycine peptidase